MPGQPTHLVQELNVGTVYISRDSKDTDILYMIYIYKAIGFNLDVW